MGQNLIKILAGICLIIFSNGCANRVMLNFNEVKPNSLVQIKTVKGNSCQGIVQTKNTSYLIMQLEKQSENLTRIERQEIATIIGQKDYPLDAQGQVISEWEIEPRKRNNNLLLYTIGGGGLSFGASFFIGSLLNRRSEDVDQGKRIMWSTAGIGTIAGTILFARAGAQRDRLLAIEKIREERLEIAKKQAEQDRLKRLKIQKELQQIKAERQKQDEEISRLKAKTEKK